MTPIGLPQTVGLALAAVHVCIVLYLVYCILFAGEPAWLMYWTLLLIVDFPASLLYMGVAKVLFRVSSSSPNRRCPRALDLHNFLLPLTLLGAVGTIYWFYLPTVVAITYSKLFG
jgi:hypothetical protein